MIETYAYHYLPLWLYFYSKILHFYLSLKKQNFQCHITRKQQLPFLNNICVVWSKPKPIIPLWLYFYSKILHFYSKILHFYSKILHFYLFLKKQNFQCHITRKQQLPFSNNICVVWSKPKPILPLWLYFYSKILHFYSKILYFYSKILHFYLLWKNKIFSVTLQESNNCRFRTIFA